MAQRRYISGTGLGGRGTYEKALGIRLELSAPGATAAAVAERHGISRRTLYRMLESLGKGEHPDIAIEDETDGSEPSAPPAPAAFENVTPVGSEQDAVAAIAQKIADGTWCDADFERYRKAWSVSRLQMRNWVIEASTRTRASIDPHYLSALFMDSVQHLRYLAEQAELNGDQKLAVEATSRAAMLIATISRNNRVRSVAAAEQRLDTTHKLIAAGWLPPAPDGLPLPTIESYEQKKEKQ